MNTIKERTRGLSSQHQPTEIEIIMQQTENYSGAHNFQGVLLIRARRGEVGFVGKEGREGGCVSILELSPKNCKLSITIIGPHDATLYMHGSQKCNV